MSQTRSPSLNRFRKIVDEFVEERNLQMGKALVIIFPYTPKYAVIYISVTGAIQIDCITT